MAKETITLTLELSREELVVLGYVVPDGRFGDPLKDIYEMERDWKIEIEDPYKVLESVHRKLWEQIGPHCK